MEDQLTLSILSRKSMRQPEEALLALQLYCDAFPQLLPEKWGFVEPDKTFRLAELARMVPTPTAFGSSSVYWTRREPEISGSLTTKWLARADNHAHATVSISSGVNSIPQDQLIAYLRRSAVALDADLAYVDVLTRTYRDFALKSQSAQFGEGIFLSTHVLRHWLPDAFWAMVFGPAYIDLFGLDRLLSAPACIVEKLDAEHVFFQLTPEVRDAVSLPVQLGVARLAVKEHLGIGAFFDRSKAYDWHRAGHQGNVFSVPTFDLSST